MGKYTNKQHNNYEISYLPIFLAWLVPGAGHWYLGKKPQAVIICITICVLFLMGLMLGSLEMIDPRYATGWFAAQIFTGAPALICWLLQNSQLTIQTLYGRGVDLGQLYTGIAGMLNLLCILDVIVPASQKRQGPSRLL